MIIYLQQTSVANIGLGFSVRLAISTGFSCLSCYGNQPSGFQKSLSGCVAKGRMANNTSPQTSPFRGPQISCKVLMLDDTIQLFSVPVSTFFLSCF